MTVRYSKVYFLFIFFFFCAFSIFAVRGSPTYIINVLPVFKSQKVIFYLFIGLEKSRQVCNRCCEKVTGLFGGDETRSGYVRYVPVTQSFYLTYHTHTTFIDVYTVNGTRTVYIFYQQKTDTQNSKVRRDSMHVPTYLLALHDFRPLFNSPVCLT